MYICVRARTRRGEGGHDDERSATETEAAAAAAANLSVVSRGLFFVTAGYCDKLEREKTLLLISLRLEALVQRCSYKEQAYGVFRTPIKVGAHRQMTFRAALISRIYFVRARVFHTRTYT